MFLFLRDRGWYSALHHLLSRKELADIVKNIERDKEELSTIETNSKNEEDFTAVKTAVAYGEAVIEVDSAVEAFLMNLLQVLIMFKFITNLEAQNRSAGGQSVIKLSDAISTLHRWIEDMKPHLITLPDKINKAARSTHSLLSIFSEFAKKLKLYNQSKHFSLFWEYMVKDEKVITFIAEFPFDVEVTMQYS